MTNSNNFSIILEKENNMGLDISVYRVVDKLKRGSGDYISLTDHPELEQFRHLAFEKTERVYGITRALIKAGHTPSDVEMTSIEMKGNVCVCTATMRDGTEVVVFPKLIKNKILVLAYVEVGYQRKGANSQFYEDGMWDSPCVTSMETLTDHWNKYFSKATPESKGGWGSGVEFTGISDKERREEFKTNIIDVFVEGEMFVQYH